MKKLLIILSLIVLIPSVAAHASLIGFWDFNEDLGTDVYDSSGLNNNGTFQDGTNSWVVGKYGSGLQFTGNPDGRVLIPDSASLDLTDLFTIEAWVNPASAIPPSVVVSKYTHPDPMIFNLRTANNSSGVWEFDATQTNLLSTTPIQLNDWQHLAVTYDGAKMKMYFNGNLESIMDATGSLNVDDNPVFIGGQNCGTSNCRDPFNGVIDEVRIYNTALTQDEILRDITFNSPIQLSLSLQQYFY